MLQYEPYDVCLIAYDLSWYSIYQINFSVNFKHFKAKELADCQFLTPSLVPNPMFQV